MSPLVSALTVLRVDEVVAAAAEGPELAVTRLRAGGLRAAQAETNVPEEVEGSAASLGVTRGGLFCRHLQSLHDHEVVRQSLTDGAGPVVLRPLASTLHLPLVLSLGLHGLGEGGRQAPCLSSSARQTDELLYLPVSGSVFYQTCLAVQVTSYMLYLIFKVEDWP